MNFQDKNFRQGLIKRCRISAISIFCLSLFFGCDSFTEVGLPDSQLNAADVFEDKTTATAAMTDIYTNIRERGMLTGYSIGLSRQLGLYTDELLPYGTPANGAANMYTNTLLASGTEITELWASSYSQIYAANAVIEGVTQSAALAQQDRDQLMGEALFVRALLHFYLANVFGDVPYVTATDYIMNRSVGRLPQAQVLQLVKADLQAAAGLLPSDNISPERVRPNKWASQALLARVCLHMQLWDEASDAASSLLNESGYTMGGDPDQVFLKDSPSTLWQLMPAYDGSNTYEGSLFIFEQGPPPSISLDPDLVNAFDPADLRRASWIKEVTDGTDIWYHAYKYKESANTGSTIECSVILRLAEQYLIRAEARARSGDYIGAQDDLNVIRNFAGLGDTGAATEEQLLGEVLLQRRLEFFTEHGHRFFDLKRLNKLDETLGPVKPGWNATDRLLPLPESELLLNPNLAPQNDGY